jgi:hypothetical protein
MGDDSEIIAGKGGITFAGPDAVALYRAMALRSGLGLYAKTGMRPNREWTPTAMLKAAGGICGKTYKRGQYEQAAADLTQWIEAMKSALPVSNND